MKGIIYFLAIVGFSSCSRTKFETNLTSEDKRWVFIEERLLRRSHEEVSYIKFKSNYTWSNYFLKSDIKNWGDNSYKWHYFEYDSSLILGDENNLKFKVLKYNDDTIFVRNSNTIEGCFINRKK